MTFIPSKELKISCYPTVREENLNISGLIVLSVNELSKKERDSVQKEELLFSKIENAVAEWEKQAKETIRLKKAQEYVKTPPVSHTFKQWEDKGNEWYELSNMVHKMTCWIRKETISCGAKKPALVRWKVNWRVSFNTPRQLANHRPGLKIAGQGDKVYTDKAEM